MGTFSEALETMAHYLVSSLTDLHEKTVLLMKEFQGTEMKIEYVEALVADMLHLGAEARS